ncbi:Hsp70 family protein [Thalassovita sp.]|uniref:Hsp70 family protein n=1 Tax=Thalassovita sp. TaxID=1979401 RepID=UPI0029DE58A0|nr:Hsp70 family protein [Thalassovita sp.]
MTCIGIDLGTTNSLVAVFEGESPKLLPNAVGEYLTPSVVGLADDHRTLLVGRAAQKRLLRYPELTKSLFKRHMGSGAGFTLGKKKLSATELSAMLLAALKKDAETYLGCEVTEAVISVPAYFNAIQRQATKDAAEIAGLQIRRLINEPTAAALASGLLDRAAESLFVVLDLGGGTFDVSILEMFDGVMEVRSSAGDSFLGGEDFTQAIARHFGDQVHLDWAKAKPKERETLLSVAEQIKRALASASEAEVTVLFRDQERRFALDVDGFEQLVGGLTGRLRRPIEKCLYDSGISLDQIDRVILVGGATRMPIIRSMAARVFRKLPERTVDPDHAIALGAAVQAGLVDRHQGLDDIVLTDVAPFSMGIESDDKARGLKGIFSPIIERNTVLPASRTRIFSTTQDNQEKVELRIFQGESAIAQDNVQIGNLMVSVPRNKAGREGIEVRFTYDVSGLLAVDVTVLSTGRVFSEVVDQLAEAMPEARKQALLKEMEKYKAHPREDQSNIVLVETIKHLYEMLLGPDRELVMSLLGRFEAALDTQDPRIIEKERAEIAQLLAEIEAGYVR